MSRTTDYKDISYIQVEMLRDGSIDAFACTAVAERGITKHGFTARGHGSDGDQVYLTGVRVGEHTVTLYTKYDPIAKSRTFSLVAADTDDAPFEKWVTNDDDDSTYAYVLVTYIGKYIPQTPPVGGTYVWAAGVWVDE